MVIGLIIESKTCAQLPSDKIFGIKISPQEMTFYGIELEVFQIDDSLPAPNFRIVAGPPPSKRRFLPGEISPRNKRYQEFFERLRTTILNKAPNFTRAKALPQSWWGLGIGRSGFSVSSAFTIDSKFRVEIYIDTGKKENNDLAFSEIKESSVVIHEKVGRDLIWDPLPDSRACRIYIDIVGTIDDEEKTLSELIEWAAPLVIKFREIFGPLVKNIQIE